MKTALAICACVILLPGCVADTMRGYVGQDIRAVQLAYGPPANEIDLGGNTRAFQWSKISVDTTPMSAVTTTDKDKKGRRTTQTQFVGGSQTVSNCLYTFLTAWDPQREAAGLSPASGNPPWTARSAISADPYWPWPRITEPSPAG